MLLHLSVLISTTTVCPVYIHLVTVKSGQEMLTSEMRKLMGGMVGAD